MPWDNGAAAGFTSGTAWLPLSQDWRQTNVACEQHDPDSMLSLYKRLIRMKKGSQALTAGAYHPVDGGPEECLVFRRESQEEGRRESLLVAVNFSTQAQKISLPADSSGFARTGRLMCSTDPHRIESPGTAGQFHLGPDEGIVVRLP